MAVSSRRSLKIAFLTRCGVSQHSHYVGERAADQARGQPLPCNHYVGHRRRGGILTCLSMPVTKGPAWPNALKVNIHWYYGTTADPEGKLHHQGSDDKGGLKEV